MSTFTLNLYHIVFATKSRVPTLDEPGREPLFGYTWGICKEHHCHFYRINAVSDHIHLLIDLHPSLALADFVKAIRQSTHTWIDHKGIFPAFEGWQVGYGAFTTDISRRDTIIAYIRNQQEHHQRRDFECEFRRLVAEAGLQWDDRYLEQGNLSEVDAVWFCFHGLFASLTNPWLIVGLALTGQALARHIDLIAL